MNRSGRMMGGQDSLQGELPLAGSGHACQAGVQAQISGKIDLVSQGLKPALLDKDGAQHGWF
jgi:hypothetical protein